MVKSSEIGPFAPHPSPPVPTGAVSSDETSLKDYAASSWGAIPAEPEFDIADYEQSSDGSND